MANRTSDLSPSVPLRISCTLSPNGLWLMLPTSDAILDNSRAETPTGWSRNERTKSESHSSVVIFVGGDRLQEAIDRFCRRRTCDE